MISEFYELVDPIEVKIVEILLDFNKGLMNKRTASMLLEKYHVNHCIDIHQYLYDKKDLITIYQSIYEEM
jgi:hypothetical protein